jgi:hypothetical protein
MPTRDLPNYLEYPQNDKKRNKRAGGWLSALALKMPIDVSWAFIKKLNNPVDRYRNTCEIDILCIFLSLSLSFYYRAQFQVKVVNKKEEPRKIVVDISCVSKRVEETRLIQSALLLWTHNHKYKRKIGRFELGVETAHMLMLLTH